VQKTQAYQLHLWQSHAGDRQAIENMSEFHQQDYLEIIGYQT
jgi:hypothetical protein